MNIWGIMTIYYSEVGMSNFQFWTPKRGNLQFALFTVGKFTEIEPEDHDEPVFVTWYLHFLFWQLTFRRESDVG